MSADAEQADATDADAPDLAFNYRDLWYVRLVPGEKNPLDSWGGYDQDFEAAEHVYSYAQVVASDHGRWGIVGIKDAKHSERRLLIFDIDIHKAPDDYDEDHVRVEDDMTPLVKSQSGGFHAYTGVWATDGNESDFNLTTYLPFDIDIRGSYVKHHVVAPMEIPGVETDYTLVNDRPIVFGEPADACERVRFAPTVDMPNDETIPLLDHDPDGGVGGAGSFSYERAEDPPEDLPTCYARGLELRHANPDDHPNTHKVNTLTALCGIAAGYSVEAMVDHFVDDYPPGGNADRGKTEYQVKHMARKVDDGDLAPPAISTLREWGILDDDETCDCDIDYHGGTASASAWSDRSGWYDPDDLDHEPTIEAADGGDEPADSSESDEQQGDPDGDDKRSIRDMFVEACTEYGIDPSAVGSTKRDDGEKVIQAVADIVPETTVGDGVMAFNRSANMLDGIDTQAVIGRVVLLDLREHGEFFRTDDDRLFYFHEPELQVYRVDDAGQRILGEDFQGMVWNHYRLFAGSFSRNLGDDMKMQAKRTAPLKEVYQFAYYDEDAGEVYVTDWDNGYYAVSPDAIEWRANGTDVYFMSDAYADPYEYLDPDECPDLPDHIPGERGAWAGEGDPLMRMFGNRINYDESAALGPLEQRDQLYIHLHTLPFIDVLNARPIMAWVGKKGSGKTVIERSIGRFIYGPEYTESVMPDDKDDFLAKVTNQTLAFLDNYDDGVEWANDVLAAVATGAGIDKRELYTTNTLRREVPRCWLSLTSRDPPFRRDDVADRTLVFRVERVEDGFVGMGNYLRQVDEHRDLLWSTYLDNVQQILAEYVERDTGTMSSSHRMADWAIFAQIVSDALGIDDIEDLLKTMETERAAFALENEQWAAAIAKWVRNRPAQARKWREAGDLCERVSDYLDETNSDLVFSLESRGLGSKISTYSTELAELFDLQVDDSRRTNRYKFAIGEQGDGDAGDQDDEDDDGFTALDRF